MHPLIDYCIILPYQWRKQDSAFFVSFVKNEKMNELSALSINIKILYSCQQAYDAEDDDGMRFRMAERTIAKWSQPFYNHFGVSINFGLRHCQRYRSKLRNTRAKMHDQ